MPKRKTNLYDPVFQQMYGNIGESINQLGLEDLDQQRTYNQPTAYSGDPNTYEAVDHANIASPGSQPSDDEEMHRLGWIDDLVYLTREKQLQGERDTAADKAAEDARDIDLLQGLDDFLTKNKEYKTIEKNLLNAQ